MSVIPEFQKKGICSSLVREELKRSQELGHASSIVVGHPDYYLRFGFKPASIWGIKAPFEMSDNAFLAIELISGTLNDAAGVVKYPQAFDQV